VFLDEPFTWQMATGVLLITMGLMMTGLSSQMFLTADGRFSKIPTTAIILGLFCGLTIAVSFIFVRMGLKDSSAPMAGTLISYLSATVVLLFYLLNPNKRRQLFQLSGKAAGLFFISGMMSLVGNLARFGALSLSPASIVAPLVLTYPVFLLVFSFLMNRKIEIFNRTVVLGTITVVAGSFFLI
jgi:drug/metabolite transporter (DMT)-like permease